MCCIHHLFVILIFIKKKKEITCRSGSYYLLYNLLQKVTRPSSINVVSKLKISLSLKVRKSKLTTLVHRLAEIKKYLHFLIYNNHKVPFYSLKYFKGDLSYLYCKFFFFTFFLDRRWSCYADFSLTIDWI